MSFRLEILYQTLFKCHFVFTILRNHKKRSTFMTNQWHLFVLLLCYKWRLMYIKFNFRIIKAKRLLKKGIRNCNFMTYYWRHLNSLCIDTFYWQCEFSLSVWLELHSRSYYLLKCLDCVMIFSRDNPQIISSFTHISLKSVHLSITEIIYNQKISCCFSYRRKLFNIHYKSFVFNYIQLIETKVHKNIQNFK